MFVQYAVYVSVSQMVKCVNRMYKRIQEKLGNFKIADNDDLTAQVICFKLTVNMEGIKSSTC